MATAYNLTWVPLTFREVTDQLLNSYQAVGGINYEDGRNLPSKHAIGELTTGLLDLLFPGYFGRRPIRSFDIASMTRRRLERVTCQLEAQIQRSFESISTNQTEKFGAQDLAREIAFDVLSKLPRIRKVLLTDAEAAFNGDPSATSEEEVILAYPGLKATAVQRLAHELYLDQVPLIPRLMTEWAHSQTGIDLHPGARIGTHFFIDHGTGIVVGETARIGNHVKMYQGVGLVARSLSAGRGLRGQKRHPTIGDRVTLYASATIVGGDTEIGDGSTIGAGVSVASTIPPNSLVVLKEGDLRIVPKRTHHRQDEPDLKYENLARTDE